MSVNLAILYSIYNTIDGDLIIHQVGKGGCFFEIKIGYMSRIQIKFFKSVIGKIAADPFRVYIVDIIIILRMGNLRSCHPFFPDDFCRCLAHAERIDKEPCCHGQGCEDPAYFQGFGFGLFAATFSAVVSVCHRSYLLSVLFFSICSSFCLPEGIFAANGASAPAGNCSPVPQLISCLFKMLPTWRNPPGRCLLYHRRSPS